MRVELIPVKVGRPAVLVESGWTIFISIRDAEYVRMLKAFKRRIFAAHPDRGGTARKVRLVIKERLRYQVSEAQWYAQYGLYPPDGFQHAQVVVERRRRLKGVTK